MVSDARGDGNPQSRNHVALVQIFGDQMYVVAVAVGVWIAGAYWFTSSTSFANPAVTIARTLSDSFAGIRPASAPMFVVMQLLGAGVAFVLIRFLYPAPAEAR